MGTARDLGLLMLRMGVGASCFSHGAQKLFGWFGGGVEESAESMSSMELEPAEPDARLAGVLEAGGGTLLALGLATGPVGAVLTGSMVVASSAHARNGLFSIDDGYELPVIYALVGTMLALTGPGRFSVDHLTGGVLNRPWMRALALVGALASAVYLVATRSVPVAEGVDNED